VIALTPAEVAGIVGGVLHTGADAAPDAADRPVAGSVETDSRRVGPGSVFVALPGASTDGALFAAGAVAAGAALVIAERPLEVAAPVVVVPDGVEALAALAREVVARVRAGGRMRVVAITGSNGKTTTKNLLAAILGAEGPTVAPRESFNNHVGAPIEMLRVDEGTRYLVVEMGAGRPGDIARLIRIVVPDIAVVLKVGLAHAGEFGGIEATARAKTEIVTELEPEHVAVLNRDDPRVAAMSEATRARVRWFGTGPDADVRASGIRATAQGTAFDLAVGGGSEAAQGADAAVRHVRLRILGEHHVHNALAALAVADELGVDPVRAIAAVEAVPRAERWRMEVLERGDGVTVINDAYNASPDSTAAALKTLAQIAADDDRRSVAVLGEMAELGPYADEEHDRIGRLAVRLNIARLVVVGAGARHIHNAAGLEGSWSGETTLVPDAASAARLLHDELRPGDVVLVKSSKSAGLRLLGDDLAGVPA
jgi:UDP-N-acetylmuramoyl-tripeptide--D-alanyl-D-alanine ligase